MIIGKEPPKWNNDGSLVLRQFLDTRIGKIFLLQLAYQRPSFSPELNMEGTALQAKILAGYEMAITNVLAMASPQLDGDIPQPTQYPSLDDDSQWPDEPKREEAPAPVKVPAPPVTDKK